MLKFIVTKSKFALQKLLIGSIKAYRALISPVLGPNCRFYPSCSAYMIEAIREHGICKGLLLGIRRLLRCNPACEGGVDPVPKIKQK